MITELKIRGQICSQPVLYKNRGSRLYATVTINTDFETNRAVTGHLTKLHVYGALASHVAALQIGDRVEAKGTLEGVVGHKGQKSLSIHSGEGYVVFLKRSGKTRKLA